MQQTRVRTDPIGLEKNPQSGNFILNLSPDQAKSIMSMMGGGGKDSHVTAQGVQVNPDKGQGITGMDQDTFSRALQSKKQVAVDPNQALQAALVTNTLKDYIPGFKRQEDLVKGQEAGLGALLKSYQKSPISAMNLKPVGSMLDFLFDTNKYAKSTDTTTHDLAMKIPGLTKDISNERYKFQTGMGNLFGRSLGDFNTASQKASESDMLKYMAGAVAQGKDPSLTGFQKYTKQEKAKDWLDKVRQDNVGSVAPIQTIASIATKHGSNLPGSGEYVGSWPLIFKNMHERVLGSGKEGSVKDIKTLETATADLAKTKLYDLSGAQASMAEFNKVKNILGMGLGQDSNVLLGAIQKMIQWKINDIVFATNNQIGYRDELLRSGGRNAILRPWVSAAKTFGVEYSLDNPFKKNRRTVKPTGSIKGLDPLITGKKKIKTPPADDDDGFGKMGE